MYFRMVLVDDKLTMVHGDSLMGDITNNSIVQVESLSTITLDTQFIDNKGAQTEDNIVSCCLSDKDVNLS